LRESLGKLFCVYRSYFILILICSANAAKKPNAVMSYVNYKLDVVIRYGVILEGWPEGIDFACPSKLGNNLSVLNRLKDAIVPGTCKFRQLTTAEHRSFREEYERQLASGQLANPSRKTRKDAGKKRTREVLSETDSEPGETEAPSAPAPVATEPIASRVGKRPLTKKARYADPVDDSTESSGDSGIDDDDFTPPSPRSVTSDQTPSLPAADPAATASSPSHLLDAPRFAYLHGEVPRNAHGRRIFSATPPLAHPVGKRKRVPTKVSHLGFEGVDESNKENRDGAVNRK
jgi:hypothetical protein